jgi:hypothetical protein
VTIPFNFYDLIEAFAEPGCAVCTLVQRDVRHFIDAQLYEFVNMPETHTAFRDGRGLCAIHSAQLADFGASVLGIAILHAAVLDELLNTVEASQGTVWSGFGRLLGGRHGLADALEPAGECIACAALERSERSHLWALVNHLDDTRLREAYDASDGLCLPHFRMALRAGKADLLTSIQTGIWRRLKSELEEFARKYDVTHADEAMSAAEGNSWRRALINAAGLPAVFGLRARNRSVK